MCRGTVEGARRCPCDTSAARQARRQRVRLTGKYQGKLTPPAEDTATPAAQTNKTETPEERHSRIIQEITTLSDEIAELSSSTSLHHALQKHALPEHTIKAYKELDEKTIQLGRHVEEIAVTKYGAPTDEHILEESEKLREAHLAEKNAVNAETQKVTEEFLQANEELYRAARQKYDQEHGDGEFSNRTFAEREQLVPELLPEQAQEVKELNDQYGAIVAQRAGLHQKAVEEETALRYGLLQKRNEANKEALQEAGVVFAQPETLNISEESNPTAKKALDSALPYVPQSWVDASNERAERHNTELIIKGTSGRAHYRDRTYHEVNEPYTKAQRAHIVNEGDDPNDDNSSAGIKYVPFPETGNWQDPLNPSRTYGRPTHMMEEGQAAWVSIEMDVKESESQAKGKGWEKHTFNSRELVIDENTGDVDFVETPKTVWRRPKKGFSKNVKGVVAELTVPNKNEGGNVMSEAKGSSTALHEFGHRAQASDKRVQVLEHAFLYRRTGKHQGDGEKLTSIYEAQKGKEPEIGVKDSFTHHYIGKFYEDGYTEVNSMGLQMLWAGEQGSFAGLKDTKADSDMKHFMLGMLTATGKTKYESPYST